GDGGNGMVAFRREKYVPRGGPSGGDGGRGGSIYVQGDAQRTTLLDFRHKRTFRAPDGEHGGSDNCHGKDGEDIVIPVPLGTLVYEGDQLLADVREDRQRVLVARGGRGGLGNQHFATSVNQTPRFAQRGEPGESRALDLQLKLLADAGIVGAPNAGKSTLLASVSAARPKIAGYPFTTIEPQLGVVAIDIDANFVLVEVPGLIEGASSGAGLGDKFLRHVERTLVLIHLIDGALAPDEALAQKAMIEAELRAWNPELLRKRRILAVSKLDVSSAKEVLAAVEASSGERVFGVSAATGQGVRALMAAAYAAILEARQEGNADAPAAGAVVLRPRPVSSRRRVEVSKEGDAYRVAGEALERLATMTDLASDEGRAFFARALARSGALRRLERLGLRAGDTVRVGAAEFVYS
ncbi:MAG: GTPase ObgE, partial [Candidatus Eremiobacteraeota bacterium]|nr:GTPase ObgE [Candidatus Eremiobacteraeota bacterium]